MIQDVNEVRLNAMTPDQAKALAEEMRGRPVADLRKTLNAERKELSDSMKLASRNGEGGEVIYDFSSVEKYKDMSEGERRESFSKSNDRLNIMGAVLSEKTFYNDVANSLNTAQEEMTEERFAAMAERKDLDARFNAGVPVRGISDLFAAQPEYQRTFVENTHINGVSKSAVMKGITGAEFMNAVFQRTGVSSSGWEPQIVRSGRVVESALRPDQLIDRLPMVQAMNGGYAWVQETTLSAESTANRVPRERAEGGASEELTLEVTEKDVKVQRISCIIPVTDEQLADEPGARMYLEMRLPQQVRQRLDWQAIRGSGTAPNMTGFGQVSGINTFAATSGDKILDQFIKAEEEIWVDTFRMADLIALPMKEFVKVQTTKDTEGQYLYGNPAATSMSGQSLWGIPMVVNDACEANTAYVFHTPEKLLVMADGVEVVYGYNSDDFAKCKVSIRCVLRANFADLRPTSTCKITALNNAS